VSNKLGLYFSWEAHRHPRGRALENRLKKFSKPEATKPDFKPAAIRRRNGLEKRLDCTAVAHATKV
jgi:hypothetical protein